MRQCSILLVLCFFIAAFPAFASGEPDFTPLDGANKPDFVPLNDIKVFLVRDRRLLVVQNLGDCRVAINLYGMDKSYTKLIEYLSDSYIPLAEGTMMVTAASGNDSAEPAILIRCHNGNLEIDSPFPESIIRK